MKPSTRMRRAVPDWAFNPRTIADQQIDALQRFPLVHPKVLQSVRRAILRSFPYGFFYFVEHDRLVVVAVIHLKLDILAILLRRSGA